jgi:PTS system galactitol-specific IIA component
VADVGARALFSAELCVPSMVATSAEEAIRALARLLAEKGHVLPSFEAAAVLREKKSPTGLPFPDAPVGLPHAEPEHVKTAAVAVALLASPVRFREMGSPAVQLEARIVVMPALTAKDQAAAGLAALLELLQDDKLRAALLAAKTPEQMLAAIQANRSEGG